MKAEIKKLHSPDIQDLGIFHPNDENVFSFLLQMIVGRVDKEEEESFDMIVCTPQWIKSNHLKGDVIFGLHYLIVLEYNYESILNTLTQYVANIEGSTWEDIANQLSKIGRWEFENYKI